DFIRLLDKYVSIAYLVLIGVGCIVCFSSIFFVYNNIRLVIFSKRQLIETMKLVGATPGFIRFPFIVEGVFQAFFGVLFSYGALLGINTMLKTQNVLIDFPKVQIFGLLALLSILIGVFGSILSANRFLKY
ncbi:cell division protein FtsX, partial [candidate division KSB1 bacterium]|nr:cell division protein FtsX [candidate division KSB1 bacterium]